MKLTAFRIGVLSGLTLFLCASLGTYLLVQSLDRPRYIFEGTTSGADLTRHGARTIEVETTYGLLTRQTCNGGCDDLSYELGGGDNGVSIRVLDAAGRCLSCDQGVYVTSGRATSLHVGGADELQVSWGPVGTRSDGAKAPAPAVTENRNTTRP